MMNSMNTIDKKDKNNKLYLIWRSADPQVRLRQKIGILTKEGGSYRFTYLKDEVEEAKRKGFTYFPGFTEINKTYENNALFANIETRLINKKRADYLDLLNRYGLDVNSDSWDILVATKGRLPTDDFEFVVPFDSQRTEFEFDIAGTRYRDIFKEENQEKLWELKKNENKKLILECEPNNKYDNHAVAVFANILKSDDGKTERMHLGYVPKYYSEEVFNKLSNPDISYSAYIKRVDLGNPNYDEKITALVSLIFSKTE